MRTLAALALALSAAPATHAASFGRDFAISGAYLADKTVFGEMRAGASYGGFGLELWGYRLHDRAYRHPLDAFHTTISITAASHAEGYVLAGIAGISYTRASAAGSVYTGAAAPDVGGRFLWDVAPLWKLDLEGRLSMFEDGYGFVGGVALHRRLTDAMHATFGWRVFWSTQEGADDVVKNGVALGLAF